MAIDAAEQIEKFQEFVDQSYQQQLHENLARGHQFLVMDFFELTKYDPNLADQLLEEPEETLKAAEVALEQFDVKGKFRVRFKGLPKSQEIFIRNLRAKHLSKFIAMEGIIRQSSEVRPQAVSAKFECPSCGNTISMPQIDQSFREPSRCTCGRKGKFRLLSKDLVDVQRLVIEESPENLEGGAQPKRMQVFLREDLVEPRMEKRTVPGKRIVVNGSLYEVPIPTRTGGTSTRFDLALESNFLDTVDEDFSDVVISGEDEKEIKKLAKDKKIYERLVASVSPSIYGHDKIKEAIMLQLFGGIRKTKKDGTVVRGDIHLLLVGDPGCVVGETQVSLYNEGMKAIDTLGTRNLQKINHTVTKIGTPQDSRQHAVANVYHKYENRIILKVVTETGKELTCTPEHQLLGEEGWKRTDSFLLGEKIRVMPEIPHAITELVATDFFYLEGKTCPLKEVYLPKKVSPELAALYGYIIGDGNISLKGYSVTCYVPEAEKELVPKLYGLWERVFHVTPAMVVQAPKESFIHNANGTVRVVKTVQEIYRLETNSRQIAHALQFLKHKEVPQAIFQSPKPVIASFIRWLFEADGCAFGNGRGRTSIQLKSNSPKLLRNVQLLLLYFGIQARIVADNLCIRRAHDMELYMKEIGFVSRKKNLALDKVRAVIRLRSKRRKPSQEWEKIVSVDLAGIDTVYDFEVPGDNMYISNGIVSHNCGKSQMLTFVHKTSPKSRYVAGRSASGAGLCVSPQSLILTNPGGITTVEGIVEPRVKGEQMFRPGVWKKEGVGDLKVQSMSSSLQMQSQVPSALWKLEAPQQMVEIYLASGKRIQLTGNTQLFVMEKGVVGWRKSLELRDGAYVATPTQLIGGDQEGGSIVDLVHCNPVVHNIKPFVKQVVEKLVKKYGTVRKAARALGIRENQLYFHWVNPKARGNIKLENLEKICSAVDEDYKPWVREVSLYKGKKHRLPAVLTKDLLYLAGLIAGDGMILKQASGGYIIDLSNSDELIHQNFREILQDQFGLIPSVRKGSAQRPKSSRVESKILAEIFFSLGIPASPKSNRITLSPFLLHQSNPFLASFIAGYYDADGTVSCRNTKGSDSIEISSVSEQMLRLLQLVLLRYGIRARLRVRPPTTGKICGKYNRWVLTLTGIEQIRLFSQHIPLRHPYKVDQLRKILQKGAESDTNLDIIPGMGARIKPHLQKKGLSLRKIGWHTNLSRKRFQSLVALGELEDVEDFGLLAASDIFWEKIVSVREIAAPYDYVYDLTVSDSHNFVVDGVLVHNTCSVVKDEFLRGWALEAGAMVLADKGILVLDEMDKISKEDTSALHEAMEQQQISVAKANIQATLRTQTSVLAAANPKLGRFDPFTPLPNQIDMPPALINRFDLIFVMRDLPNKELDRNIATRVLDSHAYEDPVPEIEGKLLRKYLAYVKQKIFPKLTSEAIKEIKDFYVSLRATGSSGDAAIKPIPISPRQLEAVVRMAEASARIKLKNKVEVEDARRAIALLRYCMNEIGVDPETGKVDLDRMTTGISASTRGRILEVRNVIFELCEERQGAISIEDDLKPKVFEKGFSEQKLEEAIDKLKRSGDIFEPKRGWLQKI